MADTQDIRSWSVLLVDDEPDNIEVVAETLEYYGMTVRTAENGELALKALEDFSPNLILLDLSMPVMDGWQMLRHLKANLQTRSLPVIALSAHAIIGDKDRALDAGFTGYMTKPVNIRTLIEDLRAALETPLKSMSSD